MTKAAIKVRNQFGPGYPSDPRMLQVLTAAQLNLSMLKTAELAGVPRTTMNQWFAEDERGNLRYPDFVQEFMRLRAVPVAKLAQTVLDGALRDPKLALEVLRTLDPDRWSPPRRYEHTGADGGPIKSEKQIDHKVRGVDKKWTDEIRRSVFGIEDDDGA